MTAHEQIFSSAAFAAGKPGAEATRALASRKQAPGKEKEAAGKAHLRAFCHSLARKQANSARQRTSPMTTHDQILSATEFATGKTGASLTSWIGAVAQRVAIWIDTCADYYAAAAMYEQLSRLSDAELARRGPSPPTLAHDVRAQCDRGWQP